MSNRQVASNYKYAMNDEEYKRKLSEVAEWEIPNVTCGGNPKTGRGAGRPSKEAKYQEEHEQVFLDLFGGKNPTLHPFVTKIKVASCVCEDCGKLCENGRKKDISLYQTNRPHWREKCVTCGLNQNPNTGEFDLTQKEFNYVWSLWLRNTSSKSYAYKKKDAATNNADDLSSDK